jgi:dTDP-4-amino-4,6-dideoxygalactose transaminase
MQKNSPIYCANPGQEFIEDKKDLLEVIDKVLTKGNYILGDEVDNFEKEFANYIGGKDCIAVANGTDAISYALKGLGILPGDEVITVSHSAVATVSAIELIGAIPVFADIDLETRCMCPNSLKSLITPKVKAIVVVHIYGQPAKLNEIQKIAKEHNLFLLEDCAQAHGAKYNNEIVGSIGDVSAFSFYPTKNLGALGDGGAIVVKNNKDLADRIRALRQYGWKERYISDISGGNSRLDELQAGILRYKLKKLDARNKQRQEIAKFYDNLLAGFDVETPKLVTNTAHVYHQYVITYSRRDQLKKYLNEQNVVATLHYPLAIHQQPAYLEKIRGYDNLHNTEKLYSNILSLPVYPQLTDSQVNYIGEVLKGFWSK